MEVCVRIFGWVGVRGFLCESGWVGVCEVVFWVGGFLWTFVMGE